MYSETINPIYSLFNEDVCSHSPNAGARHNFVEKRTTVDGQTGLYHVCEYCGKSAGEVGEEAYDNFVAELPATGYDSDGWLCWRLSVNRFGPYSSSTSIATFSLGYSYSVTVKTERSYDNVTAFFDEFTAPISGNYQLSAFWHSTDKDAVCLVRTGSSYLAYCGFNNVLGESGVAIPAGELFTIANSNVPKSYAQGETIVTGGGFSISVSSKSFQTISGYWELSCIPVTSFGNTYDITTHPTAITGGNYDIAGDDGTINTVTNNNQIVNETNNTYYTPGTGQTSNITDWIIWQSTIFIKSVSSEW